MSWPTRPPGAPRPAGVVKVGALSHDVRTNPSPFRNPTAEEVIQLRQNAGMSQAEAAKSVHASRAAWSQWETGERPMHPVFWRLFRVAVSKKTVGAVTAHLADPDDSVTWLVTDAEKAVSWASSPAP